MAFPTGIVPPGFLELDGSVQSIATYPDLAAYLGTTYNKGDEGAGNFRLPESRGEFLRGWDHGRGADAGRAVGSWQKGSEHIFDTGTSVANVADRNSVTSPVTALSNMGYDTVSASDYPGAEYTVSTPNTNAPVSNNDQTAFGATRPRNLAVMWCIKAWNAPVNQGNIDIAALSALAQQATETNQGTAKIATQAFTDSGTDDATIVTPKKLRLGFQILKAGNGYVVFPSWLGGLIIQWGYASIPAASTTVPFSLSYPNACLCVQTSASNVSGAADVAELTSTPGKNGFTAVGVSSGISGSPLQTATNFYWLSIGH
jgi:microcystin-dependent protein